MIDVLSTAAWLVVIVVPWFVGVFSMCQWAYNIGRSHGA